MIVVKEKNPKLARQRIEDEFTNIHSGSLVYRDGKKLSKPQPGYPKVKSIIDGVEHGLRFQTQYRLMYPWRNNSDLHDAMQALAHSIEGLVHNRTKDSKIPHPYPRGHLYTQPEEPEIIVERSAEWPNSSNRVGVFWDFNDCLVAGDGDVLLKLTADCFRYQMAHMSPLSLLINGDRESVNYATVAHHAQIRMQGANVACGTDRNPEADRCSQCNAVIVGLKFIDEENNSAFCIGCRSHSARNYRVYEMKQKELEHAKSIAFDSERAEVVEELRVANRKKLPCGTICYVGDKYVFVEAAHQIVYGPVIDDISPDKKLVSVVVVTSRAY